MIGSRISRKSANLSRDGITERTSSTHPAADPISRISEASALVAAILDHQWVLDLITLDQHSVLESAAIDELRACSLRVDPMTLLVLGVVPGRLNERIAVAANGSWHVIELDPLFRQLNRSRRKAYRSSVSTNARFTSVGGLAEALPLRAESVDTVLSLFLLHELPAEHRDSVVAEASRVLKPGGALVLADFADAVSWRGRLLLGMFVTMGQKHLRSFVRRPILPSLHSDRLRLLRQEFSCGRTFQFLVAQKAQ